jgi:hypothetical protein
MPAARRHTPPQQLPRLREDFVGAGCQLMAIDPRDVGSIVGVLLEPPAIDQADERLPQIRLRLPIKEEGRHDHAPRSLPQLVCQERG